MNLLKKVALLRTIKTRGNIFIDDHTSIKVSKLINSTSKSTIIDIFGNFGLISKALCASKKCSQIVPIEDCTKFTNYYKIIQDESHVATNYHLIDKLSKQYVNVSKTIEFSFQQEFFIDLLKKGSEIKIISTVYKPIMFFNIFINLSKLILTKQNIENITGSELYLLDIGNAYEKLTKKDNLIKCFIDEIFNLKQKIRIDGVMNKPYCNKETATLLVFQLNPSPLEVKNFELLLYVFKMLTLKKQSVLNQNIELFLPASRMSLKYLTDKSLIDKKCGDLNLRDLVDVMSSLQKWHLETFNSEFVPRKSSY